MNKNVACSFVSGLLLALIFGAVCFWSDWTVKGVSTIVVPDDYLTIQEAINNANDGDTISVKAGSYYGCVVLNKSLNLIGEDWETAIIDGNGTGNVVTINANSVNITGFAVQDSGSTAGAVGILLDGADLCNVSGNNIRDNFDSGISLEWSSSNLIAANSIVTNDVVTNLEGGIAVIYSHNNTVTGNYVALHGIVGIAVAWSHDNTLSWNNVTQIAGSPDFHSINLWRSERNRISQNRVWASKGYGIRIEGQSNNNTIVQNTMSENGYGLYIANSTQNMIFNNNIISNSQQVHVDSGSINTWNGSYPSGGNYWSDYGGVDQFSGPYQNVTGSDGIGDTPYTIDTNNVDYFPLMVPYNPSPIGGDLNADGVVDIFDIVIVALEFGRPPPPIEDERADVNKDGVVDIFDIAIVAIHFGESAGG